MKLNYITLMVGNLEQSLDFYGGLLGLQTLRRFTIPQGAIAFVADKKGDTMLELIQSEQAEPVRASGMVLSFLADRPLAELRERAVAMGYPATAMVSQPPKPAHFTVTDPNGLRVELSE